VVSAVASIPELRAAADDLDRARLDLDIALEKHPTVSYWQRHHVGALAFDVVEGVHNIVLPAATALEAEWARTDALLAETLIPFIAGDIPETKRRSGATIDYSARDRASAQLRLSFKLLLYSLRALQDALNVCCFTVIEGCRPSRKASSIYYAVGHPASPVGRVVIDDLPGYSEWLERWREQRNRVKNGVGFGTFMLDGDIGIQFQAVMDDGSIIGDVANRIGLVTLGEAVNQTSRLVCAVRGRAALD
jgi:hypothetical protein